MIGFRRIGEYNVIYSLLCKEFKLMCYNELIMSFPKSNLTRNELCAARADRRRS